MDIYWKNLFTDVHDGSFSYHTIKEDACLIKKKKTNSHGLDAHCWNKQARSFERHWKVHLEDTQIA